LSLPAARTNAAAVSAGYYYSNLYFMRGRYYDAAIVRFISRDPVGLGRRWANVQPRKLVQASPADTVRVGAIWASRPLSSITAYAARSAWAAGPGHAEPPPVLRRKGDNALNGQPSARRRSGRRRCDARGRRWQREAT
jgi:hypothetical protein